MTWRSVALSIGASVERLRAGDMVAALHRSVHTGYSFKATLCPDDWRGTIFCRASVSGIMGETVRGG